MRMVCVLIGKKILLVFMLVVIFGKIGWRFGFIIFICLICWRWFMFVVCSCGCVMRVSRSWLLRCCWWWLVFLMNWFVSGLCWFMCLIVLIVVLVCWIFIFLFCLCWCCRNCVLCMRWLMVVYCFEVCRILIVVSWLKGVGSYFFGSDLKWFINFSGRVGKESCMGCFFIVVGDKISYGGMVIFGD